MATIAPPPVQEAHLMGSPELKPIYEKVMSGTRLSREDGLVLTQSNDLLSLGILADAARRLRTPEEQLNYVYWVHNYHINITNICEGTCKFCAFKRGEKAKDAYFWTIDEIIAQVKQYPALDTLSEFHIVSGLYKELDLPFHVDLFQALKENFPHVHLKGLTAVEIDYIAKLHNISVEETLSQLKEAGLGSMPGGGAEVFSERIRKATFPEKIPHWEWLAVHGKAHELGLNTNVTMLAGIGETWEERLDHLIYAREQQDQSGGFKTMIPLNCWYENTAIDPANGLTGFDNLKLFALSRLIADNIPYLKGYWVQHGVKMAQISLSFGVNDLDGTVTSERISHHAGTDSAQSVSESEFISMIRRAGKVPVERDTLFNIKRIIE